MPLIWPDIARDQSTSDGQCTYLRITMPFANSWSTPGPTYLNNSSVYYNPYRADPSTNLHNARADIRWPGFDVAATLNDALGSQPLLSGLALGGNRPSKLAWHEGTLWVGQYGIARFIKLIHRPARSCAPSSPSASSRW
jgi:hypothetical protein